MMPTYTARRRTRTDEYGSGREIEITGYAYKVGAEELVEHELDAAKPWTVMLNGSETCYGLGGAVVNWNRVEWDPDGEWRHDMRATMPTEDDCRLVVELVLDSYLDGHSEKKWRTT